MKPKDFPKAVGVMSERKKRKGPTPKGRIHDSVQLDPDLYLAAKHRAVDDGITKTEVINRALRMFLFGCERVLPAKESSK